MLKLEVFEDEPWTCSQCTFSNPGHAPTCEQCDCDSPIPRYEVPMPLEQLAYLAQQINYPLVFSRQMIPAIPNMLREGKEFCLR
jgi:hypothetical protein